MGEAEIPGVMMRASPPVNTGVEEHGGRGGVGARGEAGEPRWVSDPAGAPELCPCCTAGLRLKAGLAAATFSCCCCSRDKTSERTVSLSHTRREWPYQVSSIAQSTLTKCSAPPVDDVAAAELPAGAELTGPWPVPVLSLPLQLEVGLVPAPVPVPVPGRLELELELGQLWQLGRPEPEPGPELGPGPGLDPGGPEVVFD